MAKYISLTIAVLLTISLPALFLGGGEDPEPKAMIGGLCGMLVFWGAYFRMREIEKTEKSPEFTEAKKEFDGIVSVGMPVEAAETAMKAIAQLQLVTQRRYFGDKYGSKMYRVSEFDGRKSMLRILSIDGKVFEIQAYPK